MVHAKEAADAAADDVAAGTLSAQAILESAFYRTNVQGGHHVLTISACMACCVPGSITAHIIMQPTLALCLQLLLLHLAPAVPMA